MSKFIIYDSTDDGYLLSQSTTYSKARNGTGTLNANHTSGHMLVGQQASKSGNTTTYNVWQALLKFDTTAIPNSEIIGEASIRLTPDSVSGYKSAGNPLVMGQYGWGSPLSTGSWRAGATSTDGWYNPLQDAVVGTPIVFQQDISQNYGVNVTGLTQVLVQTQNAIASQAPTGDEFVSFTSSAGTTNQPVLVVYTMTRSHYLGVGHATSQLSTGEIVEIRSDGNPSTGFTLGYYTKQTANWNAIAALPAFRQGNIASPDVTDVVVDLNDNIWAIGPYVTSGNHYLIAHRFTRTGPLTWSSDDALFLASPAGQFDATTINACYTPVNPRFADTDSQRGLIVVVSHTGALSGESTVASRTGYTVIDLDAYAKNPKNQDAVQPLLGAAPDWAPVTRFTSTVKIDMACNGAARIGLVMAHEVGLGGSIGVWTAILRPAYVNGKWSLPALGTPANLMSSNTATSLSADTKVRLFYTGANRFVVIAPRNAGNPAAGAFDYSNNLLVTRAVSTLTTMFDASSYALWDAYYDADEGVVWVYYVDATTPGRIGKVAYLVATNSWDDLNDTTVATNGFTAGTNTGLKVPSQASDGRSVFAVEYNNTGGIWADKYFIDAYNSPPNAPAIDSINAFDATFDKTITWTFSDPNPSDSQSQYELQIYDNTSGASVYAPGVRTAAAPGNKGSSNITANTLVNGKTYRVRIRTTDAQGATGDWSGYTIFSTTAIGGVTITSPVDDNQVGNSNSVEVDVTYAGGAGATIASMEVVMVRVADSAVLSDTGMVANTTGSMTIGNIPSGVPVRFDVSITNSKGQVTAPSSRLYQTSYVSPDAISDLTATVNGLEIDLSWSIPIPTGSRPLATELDVYRSLDQGQTFIQIATLPPTAMGYVDAIVPHNAQPYYYIDSIQDVGYIQSNTAQASDLMRIFGCAINQRGTNPAQPWKTVAYLPYGRAANSETQELAVTMLQFQGRTRPSAEYGDSLSGGVSVRGDIPFTDNPVNGLSDTNRQAMGALLDLLRLMNGDNANALCFRDGRARKVFGTMGQLAITDSDIGSEFAFNITETDYTEVP